MPDPCQIDRSATVNRGVQGADGHGWTQTRCTPLDQPRPACDRYQAYKAAIQLPS